MTCRRGIQNILAIYSCSILMPQIHRLSNRNTSVVWTAVTGGNTPVCTADKSQWSSSTDKGSKHFSAFTGLALFLVWMQILTLEAPKFIQQQCNQILLQKTSQERTLLGISHQPNPSSSAREQGHEWLLIKQLGPRHFRHSQPGPKALSWFMFLLRLILLCLDVTSETYFKQNKS